MAIVKMNKFTLFAFEKEKEALLKKLQEFEGVQFVDLQQELQNEEMNFLKSVTTDKDILSIENELSKIKFSLDYLKPYVKKEGALKALKEGKGEISFEKLEKVVEQTDWVKNYEDLKEKESKQNSLNNERTKIESEIEALKPWINFDGKFEDLKSLKFTAYFLGTISSNYKDDFLEEFEKENFNAYLEIINESKDESCILVISLKEEENTMLEFLKGFGFTKTIINYNGNPKEIIKGYEDRIQKINKEKSKIIEQVKKLESYNKDFQLAYEYYSNKLSRAKVSENFIKSNTIVTIQGWNTLSSNKDLEECIKSVVHDNYYLEFEEAKDAENVPIVLKNNGFVEPFESITEMYSLPSYGEIDPTPVMSIFYFIFFGMMLSDAGYGVVITVATFLSLKLFKLDKGMRNFMKLFLYLGISTVIWGAIYGGWFGDAPAQFFHKAAGYLISPSNDIMKVLALAIGFGVIHIFMGLAMKAYILLRDGKVLDAIFDVGFWYISLIGIFMMLLKIGGSAGKILMIVGFIGLVLTQGRDAKTIGGKIGGGIYGLYGITGYIGDVVSYSRLLALGLATGFIANAFNLMINLIPAPFKYIVGPIIFLGGHIFNLGVNALGAYVHSSRLQYLEFFNKFYDGGGKRFTPFKSVSKFITVTNKKADAN